MSGAWNHRRAGARARVRLAWLVCLAGAALGAAPVGAQVRPDTVRTDTVRVPIPPEQVQSDTVPTDSLGEATPDSLRVVEGLPVYPQPLPIGGAFARWEIDRVELLRYHGLSLLELLEQLPGLVVTRAGAYGRPAGVSVAGLGGGSVRVYRDGFEVLPTSSATPDLQKIGLVDLESVRVERVAGEIRVHLTTYRLPDARPVSQLEVATGNYQIKVLRAMLARAVGSRHVVSGAYDLATTSGIGVAEPFSFGSGRLRWSYALRPGVGLQAEYRLASTERSSEPFPENSMRRELVLRARATPLPGLTVDGQLGRIWRNPDEPDAPPTSDDQFGQPSQPRAEESPDALDVGLRSTQGTLRAGYALPFGFLEGSVRVREGDRSGSAAADVELTARAAAHPFPWLTAEAEATDERLDGERAGHLRAGARLGPFLGLSAFASLASGERWRGLVRDTTVLRRDTVVENGQRTVRTDTLRLVTFPTFRTGVGELRAGVEWARWGVQLGAAALVSEGTRFLPLNLPFDRGILPFSVESATGLEVYGSVPVPLLRRDALRVHGWYQRWTESGGRPYLPSELARAAVEYHDLRADGQFEPTLRLEAAYRGRSLGPGPDGRFTAVTDPYALLNLFLQLRILDLRAFAILENLNNNRVAADLPGVFLPGPRAYYGIRWIFRN